MPATRVPDPILVALELRVPERELEAERHRLRVHAVRAPDHRRPPVLEGARAHRLAQPREALQDQIAGVAHLKGLGGVDHVGRGEAEVQPARRGADVLLHGGGEGDHVVLRGALDLLDARGGEGGLLADVAGGLGRHDAGARHRVERGQFDRQPGLVPPLVAPDATHLWDVCSEESCAWRPRRRPQSIHDTEASNFTTP